jgi:acetylornithine deacetylase/succinyl-diaminopimelate desuccinylase-like protein
MGEGSCNHARSRVLREIDASADGLLTFLAHYVRQKSVNPGRATPEEPGNTRTAQEWLRNQLAEFGCFDELDLWEGTTDQPNLAAVVRGGGGHGRPLMYNGHTDTVQVSPEQRAEWLGGDPWSGHIEDGKLYGRGATDMKGGNAAFAWAVRCLAAAGFRPAADLIVTYSIGEETGEAEIGPLSVLERGYRAPLIVNGEPTNLRVAPATMGWFFFRITVEGKSLHPAARYTAIYPRPGDEPPAGVDAVEKARKLMDALSHLEHDWALHQHHPVMPPGGMNLCHVSIQGGSYRAEMPPSCEVVYAVVYNPALTGDQVLGQIQAVIDGVTQADSWLREHPPMIDYPVIHRVLDPVNLPMDHEAVTSLQRAYRTALDREPELGCLSGPCDANIMTGEGETTIIFGPGDLAFGAHGTSEFVPVDQIIEACKVYAHLIIDWCGVVADPAHEPQLSPGSS